MELSKGFKQTDIGAIPDDWDVKQLSEISKEIFLGLTTKVDYVNRGGVPLIRATDITNGKLIFENARNISEEQHRKLTKYRKAQKGDVLVSKSGSLGVCAIVDTDKEFSIYESIIAIKPKETLSSDFLMCLLRDHSVQMRMIGGKVGSGVAHLNLESFRPLAVPLPLDKKEQEAIANVLSDADVYIESLEKLIAKKRLIKKGVMQELLTGKRRMAGFSKKWNEIALADHAKFYKGKGLPKSAISESGIHPCIHYGELFTFYKETINSIKSRTNQSGDIFLSQKNDVLMPTSDVTPRGLAKASCVTQPNIILGGDILVIRPSADLSGSFLSYVIRFLDKQILQLVSGTTVFHIYASDMKKFRFSMPEIKEQYQIVTILDELEDEVVSLETKLSKARLVKQGMMQELLTGRIRLI